MYWLYSYHHTDSSAKYLLPCSFSRNRNVYDMLISRHNTHFNMLISLIYLLYVFVWLTWKLENFFKWDDFISLFFFSQLVRNWNEHIESLFHAYIFFLLKRVFTESGFFFFCVFYTMILTIIYDTMRVEISRKNFLKHNTRKYS